jgi:glutathione S-transferase
MTNTTARLFELPHASTTAGPSYSPFCNKVHAALRYLGVPYQRIHASRPDAHGGKNGQVPILEINGERIEDSTAILQRLVAMYPERLCPADPTLAAQAWLWEQFSDTALNGYLVAARWADDQNWPMVRKAYFSEMPKPVFAVVPNLLRRRVKKALLARDVTRAGTATTWTNLRTTLDQLDAIAPVSQFLFGETPSVADISIFAQVGSLQTPLTPSQSEEVERRHKLAAWLARIGNAVHAHQS